MGVVTQERNLETPDGMMRVYMARPEGGAAGPGLLVVHEVFGLTEHIQDVCRRFAEEGFVTAAPDLYHRLRTKTAPYDDVPTAMGMRKQHTEAQLMEDLDITLRFLAARGEVRSGLCGAIGFCSGGRDAFALATRSSDVLALVSFYGPIAAEEPDPPISRAAKLEAPSLFVFGGHDPLISADQVERVRGTLDGLGKDFEIEVYPDAGHGFFCDERPVNYNAEAAKDVWGKTVDFLYRYLDF
jgi:carboxymethylenebutenolidase